MSGTSQFTKRSLLPVDAATAFRWHERPGALQRLTPPWERVEVIETPTSLQPGTEAKIRVFIGPWSKVWVARHTRYVPDREFQDVQVSGPFASFEHTHRIIPQDQQSCWLEDQIEFAPPGGSIGRWLGSGWIRQTLDRAFRYRHAVTTADLAAQSQHRGASTMKVLITGATGLVGMALQPLLTTAGHEVLRLSRRATNDPQNLVWNPDTGEIPTARLEGLDAVVHLAGENIAGARWTPAVKQRLRSSRVDGTRLLCETLAKLKQPPKTLIAASAIGYYGDRGLEALTEDAAPGTGFLPELCQEWEAATQPAVDAGIRVVRLRIGVVLSTKGGALQKMLLPFKLGGGGVVGSGKQYWSWISLDDLIGSIQHCLLDNSLSGPVNAVAPNPATNYEFTKTLGAVLNRPTLIPLPGFAAKLVLGQMAEDLLLASARVLPSKLQTTGYQFRQPTLEAALRHELGR